MSGKKEWYIIDGYRPSPTPDPSAEYVGHESVMILNTNEVDAHLLISIYFEDRDPVENIPMTVPAKRIRAFKTDDCEALGGLALGVGVAPAFLLCGAGFGLLEKSSRGGAILTGGTLGCIYLAAISGLDGMSELLPSLLTAGAIFLAGDSAGLVEGSPIQRLALWRRRAAVQAART